MRRSNYNKIFSGLLLIFIFTVPFYQASANTITDIGCLASEVVAPGNCELAQSAVDTVSSAAKNLIEINVQKTAYSLLIIVLSWVGNAIAFMADLVNQAAHTIIGGSTIPVVGVTWTILRDFTNMMFIVILIYMAFATIFNQTNYSFQKMIVRFIIVAILINFSLAIGDFVINVSQVLSNVFLTSIGDLSLRLGQYLNPSALIFGAAGPPASLSSAATGPGLDGAMALLFSISASVFLGLIFLFSLAVAAVFALIRIPIIWGLLIVSPLAWMAHILPSSQGWWKRWWSEFFSWNLFLPIYLFFLYIGLLFLSQQQTVINKVLSTSASTPIFSATSSLTFNLVFFYLFTAAIMIGGAWAARTTTKKLIGGGFEAGFNMARNFVGRVSTFDSAKKAANQRFEQFRQQGFQNETLNRIYGGKEGTLRTEARYGRYMGVENTLEKEVGSKKKQLEELDTNQLRARMNSKSKAEALAARELLREKNQLGTNDLVETYKLYGGDHSAQARKFLMDVEFGKLSKAEREELMNKDKTGITDIKIRQKIAGIMAEKGDIESAEKLQSLATELYGSNEVGHRELIDSAKKKRLDVAAEALYGMKLTPPKKDSDGKPINGPDGKPELMDTKGYMADQVNKMGLKDLGEQDLKVWGNEKGDEKEYNKNNTFQSALLERLKAAQEADPAKTGKGGKHVPGAGERLLRSLQGTVKENAKKTQVLHNIEAELKWGGESSEEESGASEEEESQEEKTPGPVAYFGNSVRQANVLDLRNKPEIEIK